MFSSNLDSFLHLINVASKNNSYTTAHIFEFSIVYAITPYDLVTLSEQSPQLIFSLSPLSGETCGLYTLQTKKLQLHFFKHSHSAPQMVNEVMG